MLYGYIIILCLTMVLIGYAAGRRVGFKEGSIKTRLALPLDYKMIYLKENKCPVCGKLNNIIK